MTQRLSNQEMKPRIQTLKQPTLKPRKRRFFVNKWHLISENNFPYCKNVNNQSGKNKFIINKIENTNYAYLYVDKHLIYFGFIKIVYFECGKIILPFIQIYKPRCHTLI